VRRALLLVLALAVAVSLATAAGGWWTVPLAAGLWSRIAAVRRPVIGAALGGALGWALLLGWTAMHGPSGTLARRVAPILHLPAAALVLATLLFPALLAGAAAGVARPVPPARAALPPRAAT
jgi:hypothetical protein